MISPKPARVAKSLVTDVAEALDRARRILTGEITEDEAHAEIAAKYRHR